MTTLDERHGAYGHTGLSRDFNNCYPLLHGDHGEPQCAAVRSPIYHALTNVESDGLRFHKYAVILGVTGMLEYVLGPTPIGIPDRPYPSIFATSMSQTELRPSAGLLKSEFVRIGLTTIVAR